MVLTRGPSCKHMSTSLNLSGSRLPPASPAKSWRGEPQHQLYTVQQNNRTRETDASQTATKWHYAFTDAGQPHALLFLLLCPASRGMQLFCSTPLPLSCCSRGTQTVSVQDVNACRHNYTHTLTCCKYMNVRAAQDSWGQASTLGNATHVPPGCCMFPPLADNTDPLNPRQMHNPALNGEVERAAGWAGREG